ncbi:aminotransferase [Aspergillus germanicus]
MVITNECFEGLKAYRGYDGKLSVFRTDYNAARMQMSCSRLSLPWADATGLQQLIHALLAADAPKWLPKDRAKDFLYIQPTVISTQPSLGVQAPQSATMYMLLSYMPRVDAVLSGMKLLHPRMTWFVGGGIVPRVDRDGVSTFKGIVRIACQA